MDRTQKNRSLAIASPLEEDTLLLRTVTVNEELGRPFEIQLDLRSEDHAIDFSKILGQNVTIRLDIAGGDAAQTRYFNGFVSRFSQGEGHRRLATYRATVVPKLWFLTRTADCRIFQDKTVPDIVKEVLRERGISEIEDHLSATYTPWNYCVQYRETDFNFISRLLEQEGVYYFFTHENGKHTIHLCDSPAAHTPFKGYEQVPFREDVSTDRESIWSWTMEEEIQPARYALADFDHTNTGKDLNVRSNLDVQPPNTHEVFDFPGEYEESDDGSTWARIRLQELHCHAKMSEGRTGARGIAVGSLFEMTDHPREDQCRKFLVTSATHSFSNDDFDSGDETVPDDTTSFSAIPDDMPFRSQRLAVKPGIQGPQTAWVVGKKGEEIWTDEHGRVKVQFHWDRACPGDENSSCWVRVAHSVAGKGWGAAGLPRIGQEVIVEFLEGDPDRPIITGRVYNGTNKPPYKLPDHATISGTKSNTSKGGGGFNEIRFEDKKGEEQVFIHGEKNCDIRIKKDCYETIEQDRHLIVTRDQFEEARNDRHETLGRDHITSVGRDRHLKVGGKEAKEVTESCSLTVKGDVIEVFRANHSEATTGDYYLKAENIVIEGLTNVTIKVGQSYIAIESGGIKIGTTGTIELESTGKTSIKGTAGFSAQGATAEVKGDASAELSSPSTTVKGDGMTTIKGGMVMIN